MAEREINSVLVADFGNVNTRLVLIDLVEGQYRLIASSRARTTAQPPLSRVALGAEHAISTMSKVSGRKLLDPEGRRLLMTPEINGEGVDVFLASSSAGRPMRVLLAALTPELSLSSGRRVLEGSYVTLVETITPDDQRDEEEQINAILNSQADLIFIVGGTDSGADTLPRKMLDQIETALALVHRGTPPTVLYAGNHSLRRLVKQRLEPLTTVFIAKNVRPAADEEQVFPAQIELAFVYDDFRTKSAGRFNEVGRECRALVPTTQGYISVMRYMADLPSEGLGPLLIDVGSANSVIAASVNGKPVYTIRTDLGVGHNVVSMLETISADRVRRWLPFDISDEALEDYVYNKQLRPATIPGTVQELILEQAFAREVVRTLVADAQPTWRVDDITLLPPFKPIIAAGAILTEAQTPGMSALLLLDALQPTDLVELRLDPHNLISALGVVSYVKPLITVQALETGGLVNLGTAFCPTGRVRQGRRAMSVRLRYGERKQIDHVVRGGEIWMAPLLPGEEVEVRVRLSRGLSIEGKRRLKRQIVAGAAGIIFDARGRPLVMPRSKNRVDYFGKWQAAMTGQPWPPVKKPVPITIPDEVQPLPQPEPPPETTLDMLRADADVGDADGGFEW